MNRNNPHRAFRLSAVAGAISLCLISGVTHAQTNVTGNIFGQVQAAPGASVIVENISTGQKRTIPLDATGRFSASALSVGTYKVSLVRDGKVVGVADDIEVKIGQGSEALFPTTVRSA